MFIAIKQGQLWVIDRTLYRNASNVIMENVNKGFMVMASDDILKITGVLDDLGADYTDLTDE